MTTCACGHEAAHHQTVWHREIPCIVAGCGCMKFLSAPRASVGDVIYFKNGSELAAALTPPDGARGFYSAFTHISAPR
jgi:hypothetical protein